MATENSPPQIRIILTVAFSSVVILAALNSVFRSYFLMMTEEVEHDHLSQARGAHQASRRGAEEPRRPRRCQSRRRCRSSRRAVERTTRPSARRPTSPRRRRTISARWSAGCAAPNQSVDRRHQRRGRQAPPRSRRVDGGPRGAAALARRRRRPYDASAPRQPVPTSAGARRRRSLRHLDAVPSHRRSPARASSLRSPRS